MNISALLVAVVIAYALGAIPSGLVLARRCSDVDLRSTGSGNVGATNVYRALGLKSAVAVFLADALKGFAPVMLARALLLPDEIVMAAGLAAVAGHVFNPWLRFKGGKGVATAFGVMLGVAPWAALAALVAWAAIALSTRLVSLASLAAALVLPFAALVVCPHPPYKIGAFVLTGIVVFAHRENISRLRRGEEKPVERKHPE